MVRAVKILKILSAILFLGTLLYVYSLLPVMVNIYPDATGWELHKEYFFYSLLAVFLVVNIFLLIIERMIRPLIPTEELLSWVRGLPFVINIYFSLIIGYIGVLNNQGSFQESSYIYLNYLGPILIVAWVSGLIFLLLNRNKTA